MHESAPFRNLTYVTSVPASRKTLPATLYDQTVAAPIRACLEKNGLVESVLYLVTTLEVPLRIEGTMNRLDSTISSVDSELTLLYHRHQVQQAARDSRPHSQSLLRQERRPLFSPGISDLPGDAPGRATISPACEI